ncbi:unnamed protein product [Bursaphelenchus okinawaensis]|uniref:Protein kinase domain-containing protein n=1 Tax=Bursaphelenchus okinawaensis TaxID=465554 RepID=A0A811KRZ9_9BILA|nr:unnamed protein product [Bursaphelenchus okinawaensis]CAG9112438.1 unnamed protein product [Bursaphelenchus okinawaensis]
MEFVQESDFQVEEFLSFGGSANVYLVNKLNGVDRKQRYAMKVMSKAVVMQTEHGIDCLMAERDLLAYVDSPFIAKLYYAVQSPSTFCFITEYVSGGTLLTFMERLGVLNIKFNNQLTKFFMSQLVLIVGYLHDSYILFRDLKPENLMLEKNGYLKLIDFGHARFIDKMNQKVHTIAGTPGYKAPETLNPADGYTKAVDWWAAGIIMYEMMYDRQPFSNEDPAVDKKYATREIKYPERSHVGPDAVNLIQQLLQKNPEKRIGKGINDYTEVQSHLFFRRTNWSAVEKRTVPPPLPVGLSTIMEMDSFPERPQKLPKEEVEEVLEGFYYISPLIDSKMAKKRKSSDVDDLESKKQCLC